MGASPLDAVDRGILYHLQEDAHQPITAIADAVGVADNTVRNRVEKLESAGIIQRYTADVDYGLAGIQHHYVFVCTAPVGEREALVRAARDIPGVVEVTTVMTGWQNVFVETVAETKEDITAIASELYDVGLPIEREHLVWSTDRTPYDGFRIEENL